MKGLDESLGAMQQPASTSAALQNVRPHDVRTGRARGARRPGQSKFLDTQVSTSAIQDLTTITLAKTSLTAPGSVLALASTTSKVRLLAAADGATTYTTGTLADTPIRGCFDEDGNGYIISGRSSSSFYFQVTKVSASGVELYTGPQITLTAGSAPKGAVVADGILYILLVIASSSYVYRVNTDDGTLVDASYWSALGGGTGVSIGIGGGLVVAGVLNTASTIKFIPISTGIVSATFTYSPAGGATRMALTVDGSGNAYAVLVADDGAGTVDATLRKISSSATQAWSVTMTNGSTDFAPVSIAYDAVNGRLGCVGSAMWNTSSAGTDSFQTRSISDGSKVTGQQPNSVSSWAAIAADGLGGFAITRTGTTTNVAKLASALTVTWTVSTGVSGGVWIASTDTQAAAAQDLMGSTRRTTLLSVAGGALYRVTAAAVSTISASFLSAAPRVVYGQAAGLYVYYVDGGNYKKYYAVDQTAATWTASTAGTLPAASSGEICRLIALWRGRIVLSGLRDDPQNWFMSASGDPLNFDYSPGTITPTQAVAGNNSPAGLMGDAISSLIPFNDDVLIFGGDHTIYQMAGDPMAGGQIDLVTSSIGMAWGRPWCMDPAGTIWFMSSRGPVYTMQPGQKPQRVSVPIDQRLAETDFANTIVRMAWDDENVGCYLFLTPTDSSEMGSRWFFDARAGGWFLDAIETSAMQPKAVATLDGDAQGDRVLLLGCQDGYVRFMDNDAEDDDGDPIDSYVLLGPIASPLLDELIVHDLQAVLGDDSGDVTWQVLPGRTATEALAADPVDEGLWTAGRNYNSHVRCAAAAAFVKLSSTDYWTLELIRARLGNAGPIRQRGA